MNASELERTEADFDPRQSGVRWTTIRLDACSAPSAPHRPFGVLAWDASRDQDEDEPTRVEPWRLRTGVPLPDRGPKKVTG